MSNDLFTIGGGESAQAIYESPHDTLVASNFRNWLANSAGLGIYAHGRIHQQSQSIVLIGDLIHKRGHLTTEDLLLMEEQALPSYGEPLSTNSRLGELTALAVVPTMNTANGEGDLIAYYQGGVVAFNTHESPRETRATGEGTFTTQGWDTKRLVSHLLNTVSAVGRYAVTTLPRDHFFRSVFGLHFLSVSLGQGTFNAENTNRLSVDVEPLLLADPEEALPGAAVGNWLNGARMFATTGLRSSDSLSSSAYGRGFVSWNQAVTFTEDRTPIPSWEGLWTVDNGIEGIHKFATTGIRPVTGDFGFLCSNHDAELYFAAIKSDSREDVRDGQRLPIEWSFETGRFSMSGLDRVKVVKDCTFEGVFTKQSHQVRVLIRTDKQEEWKVWTEFRPCDKVKSEKQQYLLTEPLGAPPKDYSEATWYQIRVEGLGYAEIRAIDLDYSDLTGKSGRKNCAVVTVVEKDPFEINSTPASTRWKL